MRNNGLRFSRSFLDKLLPTCFMLGQIKAFIANYMQLVHRQETTDGHDTMLLGPRSGETENVP